MEVAENPGNMARLIANTKLQTALVRKNVCTPESTILQTRDRVERSREKIDASDALIRRLYGSASSDENSSEE